MCGERLDRAIVKVALKQCAERVRKDEEQLRQWTALTANVGLEEVSERLRGGCLRLAEVEEQVREAAAILAEAREHQHNHVHTHKHAHSHYHDGEVTITPL